jgi:single-strand DNA-binding protein
MASLNRVILIGNLTRDVEVKNVGSSSVAGFGIAINRKWKDQSGEQKEDVTFVDITAWGKTGENIAKFFTKGKPILIEGRLKLDQWEDKEGQKRSKLSVVAENFGFIGGRDDAEGDAPARRDPPPRVNSGQVRRDAKLPEEDIPF